MTSEKSKLRPRFHVAVKLSEDTWYAPDLAGGFASEKELMESDVTRRIIKTAKKSGKQEVIIMKATYFKTLVGPEDWEEDDSTETSAEAG